MRDIELSETIAAVTRCREVGERRFQKGMIGADASETTRFTSSSRKASKTQTCRRLPVLPTARLHTSSNDSIGEKDGG